MPVDAPRLPDYGGACLSGVVPALVAPAGRRPGWVQGPAAEAETVVLLVVDGLGWGQLRARPRVAPVLTGLAGGPITSVAPTTTATALTSISFASVPAAHGMIGYRMRVAGPSGAETLNALRWTTASGDARPFVAPTTFLVGRAFDGRPVPVVTRARFAGTGFSVAHLAGANQVGWHLPSAIPVEVARLVAAGERFVYAYYDGLDTTAHVAGLGELYDAELTAVDRLVGDLLDVLGSSAALVVTADHGQVEVGDAVARLDPSVLEGAAGTSGEARFRWLHAEPGAADDLLAATSDRYGDEAWVRSFEQVEADGWFGGPLSPAVRSRVGDVALLPAGPTGYLDPGEGGGDHRLVCRHGSLTYDEVLVPLVSGWGRRGRP